MGDNYVSEPLWDYDAYENAINKVAEAGYQIHVHSIGDAATEMTLDALEFAQENNGEKDYRNVITHLQIVAKDDEVGETITYLFCVAICLIDL